MEFKTYEEWAREGRQVEKGEKSTRIGGKSVFSIEQTKEMLAQYEADFDYDDPFIWDDISQH